MPKKLYLEAGQIVGTHGVRGELRVQPWCDSPEQFADWKTLYFDEGKTPLKVKGRAHKNLALVTIEGVATVQDAAALRGRMLYVRRDDLKLPPDRHLICDLIGLRIVDADTGEEYGKLTEVSSTGANDVYHMRHLDGREILIPAIPPVIIEIDVDGGVLRLRPLKGLLDDAD